MKRYANFVALISYCLSASWWIWKWLSLIGLAGLVGSFLLENEALKLLTIFLCTAILLLASGITLFVFFRRKQQREASLNPLLDIISFKTVYAIKNKNSCEYSLDVKVRARQSGVDTYKMKYKWTGTGTERVSIQPSHYIVSDTNPTIDSSFRLRRIRFDRPLAQNEIRHFVLTITIVNVTEPARPILGKTIDDIYLGGFSQQVILPNPPKSYSYEDYHANYSESPFAMEHFSAPQSNQIERNIRHPVFGKRYCISWVS